MSLMIAQEIAKLGVRPANVRTEAFLTLEDKRQKWAITSIELRIAAETSGIDLDNLRLACRHAKARCPISQVLDVPIKLTIQAATTEPQAVA
jgi:organic hydroperoxide reductase OsmC/OhrA